MKRILFTNLGIAFLLLTGTILFGIFGYHYIEDLSFFDSFYMTIITISTVGFEEIKPLSKYGRLITILIISFGIVTAAYTIGTLLRLLIEGELKKTYGRKKVEKKILSLKDHFIICGYGRIGSLVSQQLQMHNKQFVVIENSPECIEKLEEDRILYIPLDATTEESLLKAGIMKAKGLVTALMSDADNVFITLTAKGIRPDIFVLARGSDEKSELKLKRAGATRVVCPYLLGGKRMAQILVRPTVVDFLDMAFMEDSLDLQMEEFRITPGSSLVGKDLVQSNLRKLFGVIIVLIKKHNGEMIFNPQFSEYLDANDIIVILGKRENMNRMREVI